MKTTNAATSPSSNGQISRRSFLRASALACGAGLLGGLAGCSKAGEDGDVLRLNNIYQRPCPGYSEGKLLLPIGQVLIDESFGSIPIDGSDTRLVCLDESGGVLFSKKTWWSDTEKISLPGQFEGGYAQFEDNRGVYTVDAEGQVTAEFPYDGEREVISWGGGCTITRTNTSDFDSSGALFELFAPDGTLLESFTAKERLGGELEPSITHLGHGMFRARGDGVSPLLSMHEGESDAFDFGSAVWCSNNYVSLENGKRDLAVVLYDKYLNRLEVQIGEGRCNTWWTEDGTVDENGILLTGVDNTLLSCDLKTGEQFFLDDYYASRLKARQTRFRDGLIAAKLIGSDGEVYAAVFDTHLEPRLAPMQHDGWTTTFTIEEKMLRAGGDNNLVSNTYTYYDLDGNQLFELPRTYWISDGYSGGLAVVASGRDNVGYQVYCIDRTGAIVWDGIRV